MAPVHSRQLLAWSLPTLAVLLSYFWFKRKRLGQQSDIRDTNSNQVVKVAECRAGTQNNNQSSKEHHQHQHHQQHHHQQQQQQEVAPAAAAAVAPKSCHRAMPQSAMGGVTATSVDSSPRKPFSRSLSGVDTAPIDIIIPHEMRVSKSAAHQPIISDDDLDMHIQQVISMRPSLQRTASSRQSPQKATADEQEQQQQQHKPAATSPEEGIVIVAPRVGDDTTTAAQTEAKKEAGVVAAAAVDQEPSAVAKHVVSSVEDAEKDSKKSSQQKGESMVETNEEVVQKLEERSQKLEEQTEKQAQTLEGGAQKLEDAQKVAESTVESADDVASAGAGAVAQTGGSASDANKKAVTSDQHQQQQQQQPATRSGKSKRSANRMLKEGSNSARAAELRAVQREMEEKFSTGRVPPGKRGNFGNFAKGKRAPRPADKGYGPPQGYGQQGGRGGPIERKEDAAQRRSSDRDSANHSPADIMMASPSLSNISDNGSSDSGKGGSDVATPPNSHTNAYLSSDQVVVHEFDVPTDIVGRLIGKKGSFVSQIKIKTNAEIVVKPYPPPFSDQKVCIMEGTASEIEAALKMIRRKFPLECYPKLTLQPWNSSPVQILPENLYLKLVEGINNDTIICCVESPVNLFVQFPTHPSFMNLTVLQNYINACYSTESPELPKPVPVGAICAARTKDGWFRAQIISNEDEDHSCIKFLDWGGYEIVNNNDLRKIRCDFTYLPFQATECILANIMPIIDDEEKQDEAIEYIKEISRTGLVFTQVIDYTPDGIPLVMCYVSAAPNRMISLNEVIVERGYADWIPTIEAVPQEVEEAAPQEVEEAAPQEVEEAAGAEAVAAAADVVAVAEPVPNEVEQQAQST